ncbi:MAG: TOBE-like domain-containing protein, partial [Burkholderiaceae bacterium]|nr:TOBE-like domain-containing protein [Burkholderiaceae bacterium]
DWSIDAPEHTSSLAADALAFVRPSDLVVTRHAAGAPGLATRIDRALVVGSLARLDLIPQNGPVGQIIEAHLPADEYRALGLKEGDPVLVSPRKARVFLETAEDPAALI